MVAKSSASAVRELIVNFIEYAGARIWFALVLALAGFTVEAIGLIWLAAVLRMILTPGGMAAVPAPVREVMEIATSADQRVAFALLSFAVLALARAALLLARDVFLARLQFGYVENAKTAILDAIAAAPYRAISRISSGHVSHAITSEIHDLGIAANSLMLCTVSVIALLASGALALLLSPALALTALAASTLLLLALPIAEQASRLGLILRQRRRAVADQVLCLLSGLKPAKAQGIDRPLVDALKEASAGVVQTQLDFLHLQSRTRSLWSVLAALVGLGCTAAGLLIWRIDPAVVIAFLLLSSRIAGPAVVLHQSVHQLSDCASAFSHLCELRARLETDASDVYPILPFAPSGAKTVSLRNVTYSHRDREGVSKVSITIPGGVFWGVSGESGAGKTTFVDLVTGLLTPQQGDVRTDGLPLAGCALARHRAGLAYVGQDAVLFGETLRRGFLLADANANDEIIIEMLKLVGAEDIVRRVPGGLDMPLMTREAFVSSGERQRLAIACALLRKPSLLILDEATNALDLESEAQVLGALAGLAPRPTILLIAHRAHALAMCERVLHFRQGLLYDAGAAPSLIAV